MNKVRVLCTAVLLAAGAVVVASAQQAPPTQQTPPVQQTPPTGQQVQAPAEILERIIVKVNGEILTQSELEQSQIEELRDMNKQVENRRQLSNEDVRKALLEITPALLVREVDGLLLLQRARDLNIKYTDEMFRQNIDNVMKQNKIQSEQELTKQLKEAGLTLEQLRQNFEKAFMKFEVERREVARALTLTEEEARQYYKAHPDEFMKPATVMLREIMVSVPASTTQPGTFNAAIQESAKKKIDDVRARALAGEDYLKLVAEVSEAPSKANNGLVGPIVVAELNPTLAEALEKLKPGEMTEPMRTRTGYQMFKLESRSEAEPEPFDKVRNTIAQKIYESRRDVELGKFLEKLRTQALIEWKDENFKKLYEQGLAKGKSAH